MEYFGVKASSTKLLDRHNQKSQTSDGSRLEGLTPNDDYDGALATENQEIGEFFTRLSVLLQ